LVFWHITEYGDVRESLQGCSIGEIQEVIIVSDTTPFSELAKVGKLDIVPAIFGEVIIPEEVYEEVRSGTHPAVAEIESADWIEVRSVRDSEKMYALKAAKNMGLGECAAIILAEELGAQRLLIYDKKGRREAMSRSVISKPLRNSEEGNNREIAIIQ